MKEDSYNHEVKMIDRNLLNIGGINKIIRFDNKEFLLDSTMGIIHIIGDNLELLTLDTIEKIVRIKGNIKGLDYSDKNKRVKEESLLTKLFKWIVLPNVYLYFLICSLAFYPFSLLFLITG